MVKPKREPVEREVIPGKAPPTYNLSNLVAAKTRRDVSSAVTTSEKKAEIVVIGTMNTFLETGIASEMGDSELLRALGPKRRGR